MRCIWFDFSVVALFVLFWVYLQGLCVFFLLLFGKSPVVGVCIVSNHHLCKSFQGGLLEDAQPAICVMVSYFATLILQVLKKGLNKLIFVLKSRLPSVLLEPV